MLTEPMESMRKRIVSYVEHPKRVVRRVRCSPRRVLERRGGFVMSSDCTFRARVAEVVIEWTDEQGHLGHRRSYVSPIDVYRALETLHAFHARAHREIRETRP